MIRPAEGSGLLATTRRKSFLFAALYLSEGAPIGYLWVALPTALRAAGVPLADVTALAALLVLPWTFKFAWAPLVDLGVRRGVPLQAVIVGAQAAMGATLLSLLALDPVRDFAALRSLLLAHALAAATQDVAIDAWCIRVARPAERARLTGWMQVGMLAGRSALGGGALVMTPLLGREAVIVLLVVVTTFSGLLVSFSRSPASAPASPAEALGPALVGAFARPATWAGLAFALLAGAAPRALEVVSGPFLVDRGFSPGEVGWLLAGPFIVATMVGALAGGAVGDRVSRRRLVAGSLGLVASAVGLVAMLDAGGVVGGAALATAIAASFLANGLFTAVSYALFMDLAAAGASATVFSAFMGATNGCEAWAVYTVGAFEAEHGYGAAFGLLASVSLAALAIVPWLKRAPGEDAPPEGPCGAGSPERRESRGETCQD